MSSQRFSAASAQREQEKAEATCQRYGVQAKAVKGGYTISGDGRVYATPEAAMVAYMLFPRPISCIHCKKLVKGSEYLAHTGFHGDCTMTWCQDCESLVPRSHMRQHRSRDCPRFHCKTCKGHHEYPADAVTAEARTLFRKMHTDSHQEKAALSAAAVEFASGSRFAVLQDIDTSAA